MSDTPSRTATRAWLDGAGLGRLAVTLRWGTSRLFLQALGVSAYFRRPLPGSWWRWEWYRNRHGPGSTLFVQAAWLAFLVTPPGWLFRAGGAK